MYSILGMVVNALVNFLDRKVSEEREKRSTSPKSRSGAAEVARAANLRQTTAQHDAAQQAAV